MAGARRFVAGQLEASLGLDEISLCSVQLRLIGPRIDDEEQVAFLHLSAIFEMNLLQVAGHTSPHLDHFCSFEPARIFVPLNDFLLERLIGCD